ncbi:MAG: LysR family transcriptional regulator [Rhodobacteraceae bacterium]|jgi:aminoethylphosphonate catabolism LysR family transcriptional regulator|nr:LysR family transcriptional regulator [Paracoccaceae bacterium]|tara:strand:- start:458 stop:1327 length:870 start_codon:yes stop_codon:yes gene_type:complete
MLYTSLRSFHAVALHGGFSAAARAMNISQPTLTTQVKALETRYDVELFSRIGRDVHLTPAGRELFRTTMRLTQNEAEAEDLLGSFKGLQTGVLRIAAVGPFHATDIIVAFKASYPKIDIIVEFGNSSRSFDRLLSYEADVGLIAEVHPDKRVLTLPYSTHEVVVFANAQHPFFERDSISIKDLQKQRVVQREIGSTTRTAMEKALKDNDVEIDLVLEIGSREGIWKAVEQGLGIGFVADFEFVPHPNLRAIPIKDALISTQYFLAFLRERENSRLIRAFCEVAQREVVR